MPDRIKKDRSRLLTRLHQEIGEKNNKKFVEREYRILITENGEKSMKARTDTYKQVVLEKGELGGFLTIKIKDTTASYLIAK